MLCVFTTHNFRRRIAAMQDATLSVRYLIVLGRLTGPDLLVRLWPKALAIGRLVFEVSRGEPTPGGMCLFERRLQDLLREVGRIIVEWTVNRLEPDDRLDMPGQFLWQDDYYRRKHKSPLRNLACLFGPIELSRFVYQPLEAAGRCLFPLEIQLGIVAGVATPALADYVARLSVDLTQTQTLGHLRPLGICWGAATLRKLQAAMSEALDGFRHSAQVAQVLNWLARAAKGGGPRRIALSVGRDGVMLPMVKIQKYREAAAGTMSVMDGWGRRLGTVYVGQMPESGQGQLTEQLTLLIQDVLREWTGAMPRLVYVTDAGFHPTDYFERVLSHMRHPTTGPLLEWQWIVDFYHACEYVTQLAEAIFGPGREATAWAAKMRRWLKEKPSGVFRVLRSAGALLGRRGLVGSQEKYGNAYQYLRDRVGKMDYARFRRLKLPIGSGVTEAACKILFAARFKQSGMKWTVEGGDSILTLRTIALSGIWTQVRSAYHNSYIRPQVVTEKRFSIDSVESPLNTAV
jgi:hypothetical protein